MVSEFVVGAAWLLTVGKRAASPSPPLPFTGLAPRKPLAEPPDPHPEGDGFIALRRAGGIVRAAGGRGRLTLSALGVSLLVASCASFQPPVAGDHESVKYQADLAKCRAQAEKHAAQVANATPSSAARALFSSDQPEHDELTACMVGRGYRRL